MSDPYVGEIRMFGGNYAPFGWLFCDGSLISIDENPALYNLIGTTYGGNGQTTFGLPNLLGRVPICAGQAQGLQTYVLGQMGGLEQVILVTNQLGAHSHTLFASTDNGNAGGPGGNVLSGTVNTDPYHAGTAGVQMNAASVTAAPGSNLPHDNMMPYICVNYIISLFGVYPPHN
jgi:microcystin-dependent protein